MVFTECTLKKTGAGFKRQSRPSIYRPCGMTGWKQTRGIIQVFDYIVYNKLARIAWFFQKIFLIGCQRLIVLGHFAELCQHIIIKIRTEEIGDSVVAVACAFVGTAR